METKYQLVITSGNLSGITGHHSVQCHIEETRDGETFKGIPETYGIESTALQQRHNGDIVKWRDWVAKEMLAKHKRRSLANDEVMKWHGQKFDIQESS